MGIFSSKPEPPPPVVVRRPSPPMSYYVPPSPPVSRPAPVPQYVPAPVSRPAPVPRYVPAPVSRPAPAPVSRPAPLQTAEPFPVPEFVPPPVPVQTAARVRPAVVTVTHDIADYVVINKSSKPGGSGSAFPDLSGIWHSSRCDRHILRVCQAYNQHRYECVKNCHRFHVCLGWITGNCNNNDCKMEHSFNSSHNSTLARPLINMKFREQDLCEQLKKNVEIGKRTRSKFESDSTIICPFNIINRCTRDKCSQFHIRERVLWQIKDGSWIRFTQLQTEQLEKKFCDPNEESFQIALPRNYKQGDSNQIARLKRIIGGNGVEVDFENMTLRVKNGDTYELRRLSTPSDIFSSLGTNTRWLWYQRLNNEWVFMRHAKGDKFYQTALSDCLEKQLQNGEDEIILPEIGTIDLHKLTLKRLYDSTRSLRRRPAEIVLARTKDEKPVHFREIWTDVASDSVYTTVTLPTNSIEYRFVKNIMQTTINANIQKIVRIQNPYLWKAYQLKKTKLMSKYDDSSMLREQYLFHGTKESVLDAIYEGNLDWKLYGSNVGCVFGQGTYFANQASLSDQYSIGPVKAMIVAMVLVGEACIGNSTMNLPPKNSITEVRFDTTVNEQMSPFIFVKYNNDEYYPAYTIHYTNC